MRLMIITPIFYPASGGAASYYQLLSDWLLNNHHAEEIIVITEKMPGLKHSERLMGNRLLVIRMFPYRAGAELGRLRQYFRYLIQNIQYFMLPETVRKFSPDILLVHSSFHNYFNFLKFIIPGIKKRCCCIADVRDHLMPQSHLEQLTHYYKIIACSENVIRHLEKRSDLRDRICHIPVPQESIDRERPNTSKTLIKYNLSKDGYFFYAGLIKAEKGVGFLLQTCQILRSKGIKTTLVLAGAIKDQRLARLADRIPDVRLLGAIPRHELLDLMSQAALNINLSRSEGMPRVCLEALALGCKVLLPQGIPEFDRHCPEAVASGHNSNKLAEQIIRLINTEKCTGFPFDEYHVDTVMKKYLTLFDNSLNCNTV